MSFRSKTAAFPGLDSLRNLVSDSMAIDMGSGATIIVVRGRGVVVDEPSLVAVNTSTGEVIAIGLEAQQMYGREARDVTVIAPLLDGVVADFERTKVMLAHFVRKARSGISHFSRRAITSVAIIANGAMVHARTERIGSWDITAAIINHVRRHRGLVIGEQTAERLKLELASATLPEDLAQEITIKGRDILNSGPGALEITAGEVYPVAHDVVRKIVEIISTTLAELPAEVAGDIYDRGIVLTGDGVQLSGLDTYVREQTRLPVRIADEPRYAIVRGLEQMFAEPLWLRRVMRNPHPLLDG